MASRPLVRFALLAAVLVSASAPSAFGSGEPQESFLYKNFIQASEVLDRAVAAHGGAKLLDRSLSLRFSFTGTYRDENHYARPWAHKDYRLEDGTQRLEFHEYDYSTHVDEFVLPYLPSHKLIVTADQVYILRNGKAGPASGRERAIHRVVKERTLDVQNIMQTWFLGRSDHQVPYSVLEEKIRQAEEKESKK